MLGLEDRLWKPGVSGLPWFPCALARDVDNYQNFASGSLGCFLLASLGCFAVAVVAAAAVAAAALLVSAHLPSLSVFSNGP